jgi:hypothetical protein
VDTTLSSAVYLACGWLVYVPAALVLLMHAVRTLLQSNVSELAFVVYQEA